jgi:hypothetical protein
MNANFFEAGVQIAGQIGEANLGGLFTSAAERIERIRAQEFSEQKTAAQIEAVIEEIDQAVDAVEALGLDKAAREMNEREGQARAQLSGAKRLEGLRGFGSEADGTRAVAVVQGQAELARLLHAGLIATELQREMDPGAIETTVLDVLLDGDRAVGERVYRLARQRLMALGQAQSRKATPGTPTTAGPVLATLDKAMAEFRAAHPTPAEQLRAIESEREHALARAKLKYAPLRKVVAGLRGR